MFSRRPDADAIASQRPNEGDPLWAELKTAYHEINQHYRDPGFFYLATPYSKYPKGLAVAFQDAARVAGALLNSGVNNYSPIVHGFILAKAGKIENRDLDFWLNIDMPFVQAALGIIVAKLPSWEISDGIAREIQFFSAQRKPVVYLPIIEYGVDDPLMS